MSTEVFVAVRARLVGANEQELPASVVRRLSGPLPERLRRMLELLSPLTTRTVADGARFLRDIV